MCEEKHMGSRAVVVVCRHAEVARERFGVYGGETGAIYTRTGRPFLDGVAETEAALKRVRAAVDAAGLWEELDTGWLVLDCELLPWSAKAIELIKRQYAAVGSAATAGLAATVASLRQASARGLEVDALIAAQRARAGHVERYIDA
jgi:protein phosphatase